MWKLLGRIKKKKSVWRCLQVLLAVFHCCCFVVNPAVCKKTSTWELATNNKRDKQWKSNLPKTQVKLFRPSSPLISKLFGFESLGHYEPRLPPPNWIFRNPAVVQRLPIWFPSRELLGWGHTPVGLKIYCWEASPEYSLVLFGEKSHAEVIVKFWLPALMC